MPTSKLEAELVKATKVKQAAGEPRSKYLVRMLHAGQSVPDPLWDAMSAEAQHWYNESVRLYQAHNNPADIKEFPDLTPVVQRVAMKPVEPVAVEEPPAVEEEAPAEEAAVEEAPIENGDDEEEDLPEEDLPEEEDEDGEEFEEEQPPVEEPPEEVVPLQAAKQPSKPKPAPAKPRPAVKTPSRPPKPIKAAVEVVEAKLKDRIKAKASAANGEDEEAPSRPPKPAAPGASTMIKRLLLKDVNISNAELMEHLKKHNIAVTAISVSTIRSDFRHSLRVLHEAGYCQEIPAL